MISFWYTILYVADVEKTLEFYETVFWFTRKFITDEKDYGELMSWDTTLAFASIELGKSHDTSMQEQNLEKSTLPFEIAFTTDEVDAYYSKALEHWAVSVAIPQLKPWGQTVSYVRDINGFLVEICSPISAQ